MPHSIVQVSSECAPYAKTGGLADVVGALGPALGRRGHRVLTVMPRYGSVDVEELGATVVSDVAVLAGGQLQRVHFWLLVREHDAVVFVDHPMFSQRKGIYGDAAGSFGDNHLRFCVLVRAAIEAARRVPVDGEPLGEEVIFHAHDWHASLLPVVLEGSYRTVALFGRAPVVLTVHNIAHQGRLPAAMFTDLELPPRWMAPWALEWYGDLCLLKGGLMHADAITTVSPTFAREMGTPAGGFGLDSIVRHRRPNVTGILNGLDTDTWDPATDPHLPANYTAEDPSGKAVCKGELQAELGLPVDGTVPLVGFVGRLDPQKGIELILESMPWLVQMGAQVVVLGSAAASHAWYERKLRELEHHHPRNVRAWIGFSEAMAHRIEAGADLFMMPSRFEPCGLNQLYSMRYGTVPVVRSTGGLADSVRTAGEVGDAATGFRFDAFNGYAFRDAMYRALTTWRDDPTTFSRLQRNGMAADWSWDARIPEYERVYDHVWTARKPL